MIRNCVFAVVLYVLIFQNRILFDTVTFKRVGPDFFLSNIHHAAVIRLLSWILLFPASRNVWGRG